MVPRYCLILVRRCGIVSEAAGLSEVSGINTAFEFMSRMREVEVEVLDYFLTQLNKRCESEKMVVFPRGNNQLSGDS